LSNTRKQQPDKISADCPHCGYSQLEPALAKSTICRKCGQYFSIEKLLAKEVSSLKAPSVLERLSKFMSRETTREIRCFSCLAVQIIPSAAESTSCRKCGSYIDLRDFRISGPFGRTVQTQGKVTILPKGDVTTRILCGSGRIEGKMRGYMVCTGLLEMKLEGRFLGEVDAEKLVIEKRSEMECMKPLKARSIEVNGRISGHIFCDGRVTVNKHGILKGVVHARSIVVEKGGILDGELHIGVPEAESEPAPSPVAEVDPTPEVAATPEAAEEAAPAPPIQPVRRNKPPQRGGRRMATG